MATIQDFYESVVIYTFLRLLIVAMEDPKVEASVREYDLICRLGEQFKLNDKANFRLSTKYKNKLNESNADDEEECSNHVHLPVPCCKLSNYSDSDYTSIAETWLFQCQVLALQFVLLKPLLAVTPAILQLFDVSGAGDDYSSSWESVSLWLSILENTAVTVAFYGLICFFHGTLEILEWVNPWPKFLCVKGIVFMTFYQEFMIYALSDLGAFSAAAAQQYQALLICIEMFLFSIAHYNVFKAHEWENDFKDEKINQLRVQKEMQSQGSYTESDWYLKQAIDDLFNGIKSNLNVVQQKDKKFFVEGSLTPSDAEATEIAIRQRASTIALVTDSLLNTSIKKRLTYGIDNGVESNGAVSGEDGRSNLESDALPSHHLNQSSQRSSHLSCALM
jgi:hypothetical protein